MVAPKKAPAKKAPKAKATQAPKPKTKGTGDAKADVRMVGRTSGQFLTQYVSELLEANRKHTLTDHALQKELEKEFPGRHLQAIAAYRSYHNGGKHGHGVGDPPVAPKTPVPNFREDGTPKNQPKATEPKAGKGKAKPKGKASKPGGKKPAIA